MINVTEAIQLVLKNCSNTKIELLSLAAANGCILANLIFSPVDTPPFDQSAMDGYALSFTNWDKKSELLLTGEIIAGDKANRALAKSQTVKIYTGAPLPQGADTVVIMEKTIVNNKMVTITDEKLVKGSNVRLTGSQIKKGELALQKQQLLTPAAISFLASMGIEAVMVFSKPIISIIVTGKELVKPGDEATGGQIFESNSYGLIAALDQLKISAASVEIVEDDKNIIGDAIGRQLKNDILIITGGISTGDYDFVEDALEANGVNKIFHKVKQKPGKPFYFGKAGNTLVFALPGNPAAVLTCFYTFIVPAISQFTKLDYFKTEMLPLQEDYKKKPGMTYFLKGKTNSGNVIILGNQESYKLNSFALADCLIELEEEKEFYKKGERVCVKMII